MAKKARRTWILIVVGSAIVVLIGGLVALQPNIKLLTWVVRTCALVGYVSVFLAAVSSPYMRQLVRFFGRPFVKVHHVAAVAGLVAIVVHPLAVALNSGSLNVLVPVVSSWKAFLTWGGRVAVYLIGLAALAALLRTRYRQAWRFVHMLNYIAFLLVTVHAILLGSDFGGSDFGSVAMRVVAILMALVVVGTFVHKQIQRRQLRAKRR